MSEIKMIKMLTLILGGKGRVGVTINWTNGFLDPKNVYGRWFCKEYMSKIKNDKNVDPNFGGRGGGQGSKTILLMVSLTQKTCTMIVL